MKLNEFHILDIGAGPVGHRDAVAGRNVRIRRITVQLAGSARAQNRRLAADQHPRAVRLLHERAAAFSVLRDQVDDEMIVPHLDIRIILRLLGQRPHDFIAGRIAVRMQNTALTVRPFFGERIFAVLPVELRAHPDQISHALRPFMHKHIDGGMLA